MAIPPLRKEIREYMRASEALLACVLVPDSLPLSDEEREWRRHHGDAPTV